MALEVLRNLSPVFQAKIHFWLKGCLLQNETSSCLEENGVSQKLRCPSFKVLTESVLRGLGHFQQFLGPALSESDL